MSTDFAIRPISAPAPTVVVRDVAPSRQDSAPTEVSAPQGPVAPADSAPARRDAEIALARETIFDKDTRELIFRVIDTRSDRVVRQVPEQAMLRLRAYTRALDEVNALQSRGSIRTISPLRVA